MLILSHRGYHRTVPENTLEAFEQAISLGADGIETDVRLSADGLPILFHDRNCAGHKVASLSRAELSILVGYAVPTLGEALDRFSQVFWNLEIKTPEAVPALLLHLKERTALKRLLITSFWHPILEKVADESTADCGLLVAHRPLDQNRPLTRPLRRPNLSALVWDFETLDPLLLNQLAGQGIRNFAYGVETRAEHESLTNLALDGVVTDFPEYLIRG
jgi:glycerophosphoryl diester phosphodiesterase